MLVLLIGRCNVWILQAFVLFSTILFSYEHVPVLGICVGMQMMANFQYEEGILPGLGWIPGEVKRFDESVFASNSCLPHMGWNNIVPKASPLLTNISDPRFYFFHFLFEPISIFML